VRVEGEGDWAEAMSFAAWTREARVATGWPYKEEKESERERLRMRFGICVGLDAGFVVGGSMLEGLDGEILAPRE
jgi:hypothetical protein